MTEPELDQILREWAQALLKEAEIHMEPPWAKECNIRSTIVFIPTYWPDRRLGYVNEAIMSLPPDLRNSIVAKYILGYTERKSAKIIKVTRYKVRKLVRDARQVLLQAQPR